MIANTHPIDEAEEFVGGRPALASLLKVTPAAIGNWKSRGMVPARLCPTIERLTDGRVLRVRLRPQDGAEIWPEQAAQAQGVAHAQAA